MWSDFVFYAVFCGTAFYAFYKWATVNNEYFLKRNLKHLEPRFLIGNIFGLFLKRYTPPDFMDSIYYRFPREKYEICDLKK